MPPQDALDAQDHKRALPYDLRLRNALRSEDEARIASFLQETRGAPSTPDTEGHLPIHWAILMRRPQAVRILASLGSPVDVPAEGKPSFLSMAAQIGPQALPIVEALLDCGADPDAKASWSRTPLGTAALAENIGAVDLLLERGADPDRAASEDLAPLALMTGAHHRPTHLTVDIVRRLLAAGASTDIPVLGREAGLVDATARAFLNSENSAPVFAALLLVLVRAGAPTHSVPMLSHAITLLREKHPDAISAHELLEIQAAAG